MVEGADLAGEGGGIAPGVAWCTDEVAAAAEGPVTAPVVASAFEATTRGTDLEDVLLRVDVWLQPELERGLFNGFLDGREVLDGGCVLRSPSPAAVD